MLRSWRDPGSYRGIERLVVGFDAQGEWEAMLMEAILEESEVDVGVRNMVND
jgi:hypothetical protein